MSLLGRLLKNRRAGEERTAWHLPQLQGPDDLTVTSRDFDEGGPMPRIHSARNIGGSNLSPYLAWTAPPAKTAQLLLVVEDPDVPISRPAVHCLALIDPAKDHIDQGGLGHGRTGPGVRILRSSIGRGYHGPAPIKGHGPHRYIFQLFALASPVGAAPGGTAPEKAGPRALLDSVDGGVLARGRLTGTMER